MESCGGGVVEVAAPAESGAGAAPGQKARVRMRAGAGRRSLLEPLKLALAVVAAVARSVASVIVAVFRLCCSPKLKSLEGSVVLVTGAGHGLGRELALRFAECGGVVVCVDVDEANNEVTARAINMRHAAWSAPEAASAGMAAGVAAAARAGARAYAYACDVSDHAQVLRLTEAVLRDVGRVDVLVNNAGIMPVQPMLRTKPQQVVDVVSVNLLSHFWTLMAFLPHMVARNSGHVVAISSMAGLTGLANKVPYSATKFAVTGLMDALGEELRLNAHNVKVTCVHPYFIHTRPDLPEDLHLRIPELTPEFAAAEVVRAVRQEVPCVTVPRNLLFWLNVLRTLPHDARNVWRDLFYARVVPSEDSRSTPGVAAAGMDGPGAAAARPDQTTVHLKT